MKGVVVHAKTKTYAVKCWVLTDARDMADALSAAAGLGLRGSIVVYRDKQGATVWTVEIVEVSGAAVQATIGQTLVWDQNRMTPLSAKEFAAKYVVAGS